MAAFFLGEEAVVNIMAWLIMRESIKALQFPRVRRLTTLSLRETHRVPKGEIDPSVPKKRVPYHMT